MDDKLALTDAEERAWENGMAGLIKEVSKYLKYNNIHFKVQKPFIYLRSYIETLSGLRTRLFTL